jgi:hypothetical protein
VIHKGIVLADPSSGEVSFDGPYNIALEPSGPPSCAIMSPWRAALLEEVVNDGLLAPVDPA